MDRDSSRRELLEDHSVFEVDFWSVCLTARSWNAIQLNPIDSY